MHRFLVQIVVLFLNLNWTSSASDDSLVVETAAGSVRGRLHNVIHGLSVKQFLGIPYAEPPVGQLRFARPQPAKPWNGVREAVQFGPICPQIPMKEALSTSLSENVTIEEEPQDEDCLLLNVYVPSRATAQDKLAVMVWIHGGGFTMGSGSSYNPSVLVAYHDVIVVTINYRIGVLGFFNIPGTDVKGNFGMLDQVLALKWVQQNIANLGGDPNKVTIFGESAGSMSATNHLVSPLSKGLFHHVIAQSGSASYIGNGIHVKSTENVKTFAKVLNCDGEKDLMSCLRSKSWNDVLTAQRNVTYPSYLGAQTISTVTVDGEFLTDTPRVLMSKPNGTSINSEVQVMMGVTGNEGGFWAMMAMDLYKDGVDKKFVEQSIHYADLNLYDPNKKLIEDAILFEYLDHSDINNRFKNRQALMDMFSDLIFNAPAVLDAKTLTNANVPVYFYVFDHQPHFITAPSWTGACHGVDVYFSFGVPIKYDGFYDLFKIIVPKFSDLEVGLALYTMKMWTNFAKHGDPNVGETPVVAWPRYNSSAHVHLQISLNPKVEYSFRERKVEFWNDLVPKLAKSRSSKVKGEAKKDESAVKEEL